MQTFTTFDKNFKKELKGKVAAKLIFDSCYLIGRYQTRATAVSTSKAIEIQRFYGLLSRLDIPRECEDFYPETMPFGSLRDTLRRKENFFYSRGLWFHSFHQDNTKKPFVFGEFFHEVLYFPEQFKALTGPSGLCAFVKKITSAITKRLDHQDNLKPEWKQELLDSAFSFRVVAYDTEDELLNDLFDYFLRSTRVEEKLANCDWLNFNEKYVTLPPTFEKHYQNFMELNKRLKEDYEKKRYLTLALAWFVFQDPELWRSFMRRFFFNPDGIPDLDSLISIAAEYVPHLQEINEIQSLMMRKQLATTLRQKKPFDDSIQCAAVDLFF